jgi:type IV pilus assembly protein PilY1
MRRIDVVRKILVGGKAVPRSQTVINYLIAAEDPDRDFWKRLNNQRFRVYGEGAYEIIRRCTDDNDIGNCGSGDGPTYNVRVMFSDQPEEPEGLIHENIERMRFGLMFFNDGNRFEDGGGGKDGARLALQMGTTATSLITQIENTEPDTWTPLGESMYEALRFFQATNSAYNGGTYQGKDPLEDYCQKNFVLILTDGESTKDKNIPGSIFGSTVTDTADPAFNVCDYMGMIAENEVEPDPYPDYCNEPDNDGPNGQPNNAANTLDGTYYLEGVCYYSHITDIRPDAPGQCPDEEGVYDKTCGEQNITTYTVFAFDDSEVGEELLQKAAKYGGFNDLDGGAQAGDELERKLRLAFEDILFRTSSGTSATVPATTTEGEGIVLQSYFKPRADENIDVTWLGYLRGLFVDRFGNLREDSLNGELSGDKRLCYGDGNSGDILEKLMKKVNRQPSKTVMLKSKIWR